MTIVNGWLQETRKQPSPNHDARPQDGDIDLLVIHNISLPPGEFGGPWIDRLFTNTLDPKAHPWFTHLQGLEVSAHALVRRDGSTVQYVNFGQRAWHAGLSCFNGRERCNDYSIGIELEGTDDLRYEPAQYARLAAIARALMATYPGIVPARITGHSDIAPGRKTDPGPAFDWQHFRGLIADS
jgi:AmpD protein